MKHMTSIASEWKESEEKDTPAMGGHHSMKSVKAEGWSEETGGCACSDAVRDLFAEAFPSDDEISQVTLMARDLKNDDTAPASDAEQDAQYADTLEWFRDEDVFDDVRSIASTVISKIIRCRAEAVLEEALLGLCLGSFRTDKGFMLDTRLAQVWLCGNMTGVGERHAGETSRHCA